MSAVPAAAPRPLTFTLLRMLADGAFHSGEDMAQRCGITRASVHNALHSVSEEFGVVLQSVRGRGYRLARPLYWLDATAIAAAAGEVHERLQLEILDQATSSNALLMQHAAQGAPGGSVLAVEWQTAGRGRLGRRWHAGLGDALAFSLLWRFGCGLAGLSGLSLAVGVAVIRTLRELGVHEARLKWPNDVLLPQGKLAGILLEAQGDVLGPSAVVIGIGLNLAPPAAALDQPAGDLLTCGVSLQQRSQVLGGLLRHLVQVLTTFEAQGFAALREEWEAAHQYAQRPVSLLMPDGTRIDGVALGVDDEGALRVETAGAVRLFHSGEVSLRGR
ncbi:MAG: biotin--[acetyl-CoA-carboxylase] ligase [Pseudomonadota bacterium]